MSDGFVRGRVQTISVGMPQEHEWADIRRTSIEKHAVEGAVQARTLGLDGDQVSDTKHHGGVDQAVYAYSRSELDWWETELGRPIRDGGFGENLTVVGYDVDDAEVGEQWAIGDAVFEVASVRIPCNDFKNWQRFSGYDDRAWVKRFTARQRSGAYLRVIQEGALSAGEPIRLVHQPGHGVTVSTMFRALTTERELLPQLLRVDGLIAEARRKAEEYLGSGVG